MKPLICFYIKFNLIFVIFPFTRPLKERKKVTHLKDNLVDVDDDALSYVEKKRKNKHKFILYNIFFFLKLYKYLHGN